MLQGNGRVPVREGIAMFSAEFAYLQMVLFVARDRFASDRDDQGASTLELAIISAILVVAAAAIAGIIATKVGQKGNIINGF